ncbi:MAG: TonB-dependent siderophore receptor [Pseudomonadota bacterium]
MPDQKRAILVTALMLMLSTAGINNSLAASEEAGAEPVTEELIVTAKYLSIDKINSVKTPTPVLDVPQSLSILTSEQIEAQAFRNFGDVLRYTPGLSISQGEGHRDAIIIRGVQTTADFFVDGVRDDVQYYRPLYNVEQVEVLRGSNALLFGRGGGGGVINRVQKKAVVGESFAAVSAAVDTLDANSIEFDGNIGTGEDSAFRINAYYQGLENHRDFYDGDSFAINPTFTTKFGDRTTATFSYEYVDDDRVVDRGVPSVNIADGPNEPLEDFEDTFFGSPDANETTLEAHILRARVDHDISDTLRANVTLQYADYDKTYQNLYPSDAVDLVNGTFAEVELDGYRDTTERENLILQANLIGEFTTGSVSHTVLFGVEFGDQETANARLDNEFAQNGDDQLFIPFSDPLVIPEFALQNTVRDRESDVQFTSVYLQDLITVNEQLKVLVGVRWDEFDIEVFDNIEANDGDLIGGDFDRRDTEVTPRFGLIYKPRENVSIYASYSETFLPAAGDQFLTLNLNSQSTRPQFFENREIGVKWDLTPNLSLTASVFELERESFTSADPVDPSESLLINGSVTEGFEVQLYGQLTERWTITTGYSNLDGEVETPDGSGNDGNATRQTPDHMFSIWNNFRISDKFSVGLGATYQDSFFVLEDNSVEVPDYTRVDLAAYYDVSDQLRLQLNVENLLDEEYFPDAHNNNNISTGRPLNARLTVSYNF